MRRVRRLRRHAWVDRLIKAGLRYSERNGDYYAAGITYFSVLALVPLLMISFAVAGFALANNPGMLRSLREYITSAVPSPQSSQLLNFVVDQSVHSAGTVGAIGLLVALYSGLSWITSLRQALSMQWHQQPVSIPLPKRLLFDLLALLGLGVASALSSGVTILGGRLGTMLLDSARSADPVLGDIGLHVLAVVLSLCANWLVFLWILARLPRRPVPLRGAMPGALFAAVGFEVLKQFGVIYVNSVTGSPVGAAFGPILGLLVFAYLTSRFILFVAAWMAVARDEPSAEAPPPPPAPAEIRPQVLARKGFSPGSMAASMAALFGVGTVAGWALRRFGRRH